MKTIVSKEEFLNTYRKKHWGYKALDICIENSWLPMKATPFLASIVGRLMGDGNLSKDRMVGDFRFYGDNSKLDKIKFNLERNYGLIPYSYYVHPNGGGYILRYNNAIFARLLELIGVPRGDKILKSFNVPNWIMMGTKEIKKAFLSAIFADEMGKLYRHNGSWKGLGFSMSKIETKLPDLIYFLNQLKFLLTNLDICSNEIRVIEREKFCRRDGYITCPAAFHIYVNLENRTSFYRNVGFDDEKKQKLLYSSIKAK